MKKLILSAVIVLGIGFAATAQTAPAKETKRLQPIRLIFSFYKFLLVKK